MKTKKLSAKLVLNKETVASLENRDMNSAMGGKPPTLNDVCWSPQGVSYCIACFN